MVKNLSPVSYTFLFTVRQNEGPLQTNYNRYQSHSKRACARALHELCHFLAHKVCSKLNSLLVKDIARVLILDVHL